jgi:hypothetical protein
LSVLGRGRDATDDATDGYRGRRMVAKQKGKKKEGPLSGKIERVGEGAGRNWSPDTPGGGES